MFHGERGREKGILSREIWLAWQITLVTVERKYKRSLSIETAAMLRHSEAQMQKLGDKGLLAPPAVPTLPASPLPGDESGDRQVLVSPPAKPCWSPPHQVCMTAVTVCTLITGMDYGIPTPWLLEGCSSPGRPSGPGEGGKMRNESNERALCFQRLEPYLMKIACLGL
jgi:hypothetical protein